MSKLIKQLEEHLSNSNMNMEEIIQYETKLSNEYNKVTEEYRIMFSRLEIEHNKKQQQIYNDCSHKYKTFCEYHNERYFVCEICGHEKS